MELNHNQKEQILNIIENSKQKEYKAYNKIIENAVNEWKEGKKTDQEAYNKIYKKVIKNEHYLVQRYAEMNDKKSLLTLAELFSDDIIDMTEFENLDETLKNEVLRISN